MMNIVTLEHEQETEVINKAVTILRSRIIGEVARIETIHQEFLGTAQADEEKNFTAAPGKNATLEEREAYISKGFPRDLEMISVSRAIEEAVRQIISIARPHIEKPTVTENELGFLGEKVLRIVNAGKKERLALPTRFAQAVAQRMQKNDQDIYQAKHNLLHYLREYFKIDNEASRKQIFKDQVLLLTTRIHDLCEQNREDDAHYDLSSLDKKNEGEEEQSLEEKFKPGDIFDTGGGLDEIVRDEDFRIEMEKDIKLSEPERELLECLPKDIQEDNGIISEVYSWQAYAEEWQRDALDIKKDAPAEYLDMLENILMRKMVIYTYAEQKLQEERAKKGKKPVNQKLCHKIEDFLPELSDEINILWDKIETIKKKKATKKNREKSPEGVKTELETSFLSLRKKYKKALHNFIDIEGYDNFDEVKTFQNSLSRAYADLESHCLKNRLQSAIIGSNSQDTGVALEGNKENSLTVDQYLENPNYFTQFPEKLRATKSENETMLEMACHIDLPTFFCYPDGIEPITLVYKEEDGSESSNEEKMKLIKSIISDVIERRMAIYFYATEWLESNESAEVVYFRDNLEQEILGMENALQIISRRIRWEVDVHQKYPELQVEIDYLGQSRHNLLFRFIEEDNEARHLTEPKILALTEALQERNKEISQGNIVQKKPHSSIPAAPLSEHEGGLIHHVPISLRKNETILFGRTIPYFVEKKSQCIPDHAWEKKRLSAHHHLERMMMIYFYATKRLNDIHHTIITSDNHGVQEKLVLEQDLIEEEMHALYDEIRELVGEIGKLNMYSGDESEHQTEEEKIEILINQVTALHAELDGILAQSDDDFSKKIEYYWFTLQRHLLRFRTRLLIAKEKGTTHAITSIQFEFNQEMRFIKEDMQTTLSALQASRKKQERMIGTIQKIRTLVGGNKSEE